MSAAARSGSGKWILLIGVAALALGVAAYLLLQRHIDERDFEQQYQSALEWIAVDDLPEAYEKLTELAHRRRDDVKLQLLLARTARQVDRLAEARKHLDQYEKLGGRGDVALFERRLLKLQLGNVEQMIPVVKDALRGDGPDADLAYEALARGCIASGRLFAAVEHTEEWLKKNPRRVRAWVLRAEALTELGFSFGIAKKYLYEALKLNPHHVKALLLKTLIEETPAEGARAVLAGLREREPDNKYVLTALAEACFASGDLAEADAIADKLDALEPDAGFTLFLRGRIALLRSGPAKAEPWLARYLRSDKSKIDVVVAYVDCLRLQEKHAEMIPWQKHLDVLAKGREKLLDIKEGLGKNPSDPDLTCQFGETLIDIYHFKEGLRWLHEVLRRQPDHAGAHAALAKYYRSKSDTENARKHERVLENMKTP